MKYESPYDNILDSYIGWMREAIEAMVDQTMTDDQRVTYDDVLDSLIAELSPIDEVLGAVEAMAQVAFGILEASA
jgi:hypothetical protein